MLNRLSSNTLLKSVIGVMATVVVALLATSAWESWRRLDDTARISSVANVTTSVFTAMHNLRVDKATSVRDLYADKTFTSLAPQLVESVPQRCRR